MASAGAMLKLARQRRGIRQNEAAVKLGVSPSDLSRIENDAKEPSLALLEAASKVFNVPANFFDLADRIYGAPVSVHPMWRKKADVSGAELDAVIAELNIRVMHLRRLLQATDLNPVRTIPKFDIEEYGDPERIAALLRAHWMMPRGPVPNVTQILEEAGIVVAHSNMGGSSISGVTFRVPGMPPLIVVNSDQPGDRMRHTLCHELGHIVMHQFPSPNMEKEADHFAGCFLAPAADIRPHFGTGRVDLRKLAALKPVWKMSMASLVFAADRVGKLTTAQKNYIWQQFSIAKIRTSEPPELDFPREQPTVISSLLKLHIENLGYGIADLASVLAMSVDELPDFYDLTSILGPKPSRPAGLRIVK
ncbi:XRE family transcriptional regulator [Devosia sp. 63-57]|uniref:helix-turn-helix domain-containing protein n=1 Tax=Devosia sp. 63-57 TaxID=1895751 RepID=UPI00086F8638|nr:XRE family transcriptional regulator [Devosia sp. 63-57]ODT49791.1 MAG: DNA-binding protein [Pelagibacterium sp. SCN 63-126]ODU86223.1 MAG: DNA-binding protein [Pelagibacterium sp. SCN 63-17]OJX45166.1 MAG: DNA-binding protein [Devosia sp. 63-57]